MGRRRTKAPRRGSLAYSPRKRAKSPIARVRNWPEVNIDSPKLLGFSGYKVGMSYAYILDEARGSPTFGQEVMSPITVVESPPIFVCGLRAYHRTINGLKTLGEAWAEKFPKQAERSPSKPKNPTTSLNKIEGSLSRISEFRAIILTQPWLANVPRKKPEVFEVKVGGGTVYDQLKYLTEVLGREVNVSQVFKEGQFVDVMAVTKGKGFQGPVKRFGVKKRHHKSRKTVRGVATLGPWTPHYVMYTVPRAGQMGFHQRTERNKKVLKINVDGGEISLKGGFPHYGIVRSSSILLKGSVAGPAKRLLKLRQAVHPPTNAIEEPLKITYLDLQTAQMT